MRSTLSSVGQSWYAVEANHKERGPKGLAQAVRQSAFYPPNGVTRILPEPRCGRLAWAFNQNGGRTLSSSDRRPLASMGSAQYEKSLGKVQAAVSASPLVSPSLTISPESSELLKPWDALGDSEREFLLGVARELTATS